MFINGELRYVPASTLPRLRDEFDESSAMNNTASGQLLGGPQAIPWHRRYRGALLAASTVSLFVAAGAAGPRWGVLLLVVSGIVAIFMNLGTKSRNAGELSAYSIFNPGFESLPGQLRSDQIEAEIRGGAGNVAAAGNGAGLGAFRNQPNVNDIHQRVGRVLGHGQRQNAHEEHTENDPSTQEDR